MSHEALDIITIDGESASGKSSVAEGLSRKLGYSHFDGGVIFRTMGFLMDLHRLDLSSLARSLDKYMIMKEVNFDGSIVKYKGMDISEKIQSEAAGLRAASLGSYEHFQKWFIEYLRNSVQATETPCIISGRIGGSVIFPSASHKFYLKADLYTKAKRRYEQLLGHSNSTFGFEDVVKSINSRDDLKNIIHYWKITIPESTIHINTSTMTIREVIDCIDSTILT